MRYAVAVRGDDEDTGADDVDVERDVETIVRTDIDTHADLPEWTGLHRRSAWLELPGLFAWDEIAAMVDHGRSTTASGEFRAVLCRIHHDGTSLYRVFARA